jgi:myo-inositol-1(or 4)-monophosphatase
MSSIAYKLARVAAGLANATFTLKSKHECDVAGGAALVQSAGGFVATLANTPFSCNQQAALLPGLVAGGPLLRNEIIALVDTYLLSADRGKNIGHDALSRLDRA